MWGIKFFLVSEATSEGRSLLHLLEGAMLRQYEALIRAFLKMNRRGKKCVKSICDDERT